MQRIFQYILLIALAGALVFTACTKDDGQGDADLAPLVYQDSLRVFPNPSWLYEDSVFYFAWEDFDGDMENAIVTIRFEAQNGDVSFIDVDDIETEGDTGGSLKFTRNIVDGDEGRYFITVMDEAGNFSNEIDIFLYVNPLPRDEATENDESDLD